jgi:TRAP-type C4-dicarboxylate transport system substrate-binding protein
MARDTASSAARGRQQSQEAPGRPLRPIDAAANSSNDIAGSDTFSEASGSSPAVHARTLTPMQQHDRSSTRGEGLRALARGVRALARGVRALAGATIVAAAALHASPCAAQATEHLRIVGGLAGVNQYTRHEEPFWTQRLKALSGGRATAEIVPSDRAGIRPQEMLRLVQLGVVPFGTTPLNASAVVDVEIAMPDLAGLNPDVASMRRTITAFRPHLEHVLRERYGSELLAVYAYAAQVTFCTKPIAGLADLKDRRIRYSSSTQSDWVAALGAIGVQTPFNEIVANVKSGKIDCAITGTMSGNTLGLHEVTTHLYTMPVNWGIAIFIANGAAWSALSKETQELLRRELPKLEQAIWAEAENETSNGIACNTGAPSCVGGRPGNMVVVRATAADNARRQEILSRNVLPAYLKRCGPRCAQVWNQTVGPSSGVALP